MLPDPRRVDLDAWPCTHMAEYAMITDAELLSSSIFQPGKFWYRALDQFILSTKPVPKVAPWPRQEIPVCPGSSVDQAYGWLMVHLTFSILRSLEPAQLPWQQQMSGHDVHHWSCHQTLKWVTCAVTGLLKQHALKPHTDMLCHAFFAQAPPTPKCCPCLIIRVPRHSFVESRRCAHAFTGTSTHASPGSVTLMTHFALTQTCSSSSR